MSKIRDFFLNMVRGLEVRLESEYGFFGFLLCFFSLIIIGACIRYLIGFYTIFIIPITTFIIIRRYGRNR